jgi:hypothetical protein
MKTIKTVCAFRMSALAGAETSELLSLASDFSAMNDPREISPAVVPGRRGMEQRPITRAEYLEISKTLLRKAYGCSNSKG